MIRSITVSTIAATLGIALAHFAQSTLVTDTREGQEDWYTRILFGFSSTAIGTSFRW